MAAIAMPQFFLSKRQKEMMELSNHLYAKDGGSWRCVEYQKVVLFVNNVYLRLRNVVTAVLV